MSTEVQSRADFSRVRYAMCWEDADILVRALRPQGRHCASIGSAGDNAFALLAAGAETVWVAEMNPAQVACIALREAAYRTLSHPEFLELLGVRDSHGRPELYARCRETLPDSARAYWDAVPDIIESGCVSSGKFERYFALFRKWVLPLAHGRGRVDALLTPRSPEERGRYYETVWNNRRWRGIFKVFFSRRVMGRLGRDPSFFDYVEGSVSDRILARVRHALVELDPCKNPYLHWILRGTFGKDLPLALREEAFEPIRQGLAADRFRVFEGSLEALLQREPQRRFDAFNLSDIFEYMSDDNTARLLGDLAGAANPGARLAYWNMLAPRSRPESLAHRLLPREDEAARLFFEDKAFFYSRFVVEEAA